MKPLVTVFIHALNEEKNIVKCLQSLDKSLFHPVVIDAGSDDLTAKLAEENGASLVHIVGERSTLRDQREWALNNIPVNTKWILILDADEIVSLELATRILDIATNTSDAADGYWIPHQDIVFFQWLPRTSEYPVYTMRLFKAGMASYQKRKANSHLIVLTDNTRYLKEPIIHNDTKGIRGRIHRLSTATYYEYQSLKAERSIQVKLLDLFSHDHYSRRRSLKAVYYRLPFRWIFIGFYLFFFRRGFIEGKAGFYNTILRVMHELSLEMYAYEEACKLK